MSSSAGIGVGDLQPVIIKGIGSVALGFAFHYNEIIRSWKHCGSDHVCQTEIMIQYLVAILGVSRPALTLSQAIQKRIWSGTHSGTEDDGYFAILINFGVYAMMEYVMSFILEWVRYATECLKSGDCEQGDILIWINNMKLQHCTNHTSDEIYDTNLECDAQGGDCTEGASDDENYPHGNLCALFFNEMPILMLLLFAWVAHALSVDSSADVNPARLKQAISSQPRKPIEKPRKSNESESLKKAETPKEESTDKTKSSPGSKKTESGVKKEKSLPDKDNTKEESGEKKENSSTKKGNAKENCSKEDTRKEGNTSAKKGTGKETVAKKEDTQSDKNKIDCGGNKKETAKKGGDNESEEKKGDSKPISDKNKIDCGGKEKKESFSASKSKTEGGKSNSVVTEEKGGGTSNEKTKTRTKTDGQGAKGAARGKQKSDKPNIQEVKLSCPCCRSIYVESFPDPLPVYCEKCSEKVEEKDECACKETNPARRKTAKKPTLMGKEKGLVRESPVGTRDQRIESLLECDEDLNEEPTQNMDPLQQCHLNKIMTLQNSDASNDDSNDLQDVYCQFEIYARENYHDLEEMLQRPSFCEVCSNWHIDHVHEYIQNDDAET